MDVGLNVGRSDEFIYYFEFGSRDKSLYSKNDSMRRPWFIIINERDKLCENIRHKLVQYFER